MQYHIAIIGAGFAGLGMAIRLKRAGIDNFVVLERAQEVGGTWRENHYPGAACDVPSHVYSFSFEPSQKWSRKFAPQAEILQYLKDCTDKNQLRQHIQFGSSVESAVYDESQGLWTLHVQGGRQLLTRYFILASGGLSRVSYPKIEGLQSFQGELFHTAEWQKDLSLKGKKVAVIGTGASAIQLIPSIAPELAQLKIFQRTPAWVLPKDDFAYSRQQQRILARWPWLSQLYRSLLYWQFEYRAIALLRPRLIRSAEQMGRDYIRTIVKDPKVRQQLTPHYTMGCKRILLSNDYYQTFNQAHVQLQTEAIQKITAQGILTQDGQLHEVDVIICATGFQVAEASAPFPIKGREGRDLQTEWRAGAEAYVGTTVNGFPNMFLIVGPNTGLGHNSIVFMIESQLNYILDAIKSLSRQNNKSVEVRADVQKQYNEELQARFQGTVWSTGNCKSWYHNAAGRNTTLWPGFSFQLWWRILRFDSAAYSLQNRQQIVADIPAVSDPV